MRGHENFRELTAGQALSALEPEDELALTAHLRDCADCRDLLAEMTHTAAELAYSAADVEPPASILANLRAEMAADAVDRGGAGVPVARTAPAPAASLQQRRVANAARAQRRLSVSVPVWSLGAAASVVAVAAVLTYGLKVHSDDAQAQHRAQTYAQVIKAIDSPGASEVALSSAGGPSRATAVVTDGKVWLVASGMNINDASDSIYVLWAENTRGEMVAVGKFDVTTASTPKVFEAPLPGHTASPLYFAVSEEPGLTIPSHPTEQVLSSVQA